MQLQLRDRSGGGGIMTTKQATRAWAAGNLAAAHIIAADPLRYPGLPQQWAAMVLQRAEPTIKGPLFREAA